MSKSSPQPSPQPSRLYDAVCQDANASQLERETALLTDWNATLHENAVLRGAMARLCRAVVCRMTPDEPTPEDRMELGEAWNQARGILENHSLPNYQSPK
jgi:hypothetical protein